MPTVPARSAPRRTRHGRERSGWLLALTGLALLVVSVVMMAAGARPLRAQTARPHPAPSRLAPPRLPGPGGRYQVARGPRHPGTIFLSEYARFPRMSA